MNRSYVKTAAAVTVSLVLFVSLSRIPATGANPFEKIKDAIEVTGGWDRYIYAWGDTAIPDNDRWTAVRTPHKKNNMDMGNFWDVPGEGDETKKPGKALQLWELPYKFQKSPDHDRRYKFIPLWEKTGRAEDRGFYIVQSETGCCMRNAAGAQNAADRTPEGNVFIKSADTGETGETGFWDQPGGPSRFKQGDRVGIYSRDYGTDQQYRFIPVGGGFYTIVSANGGYADVAGGKDGDGVNIQMWSPNGTASQKFRIVPTKDRRWKIYTSWGRAVCASDKAVYTWKDSDGRKLEWYFIAAGVNGVELNSSPAINTDTAYHWKISNTGKNRFTFTSRVDGKYLTAAGNASANGAQLITSSVKNDNAEWEFIIISHSGEKKSTGQLIGDRTEDVQNIVSKKLEGFNRTIKEKGYKFSVGATSVIAKTIDEITGFIENGGIGDDGIPLAEEDKEPSPLPNTIVRDPGMKAFNWRDAGLMSAVKDQRSCGSCWAFASTGVYEGVFKIMYGREIDLSEQFIVDCLRFGDLDCGSCNGGSPYNVFNALVKTSAVDELQSPYLGKDSSCSGAGAAGSYKLRKWGFVSMPDKKCEVKDVKKALCKYGPLTTSVMATEIMMAYTSGIFDERTTFNPPDRTNHAVVIIGWDDAKNAWLVRNSWGENWGEKGYIWIDYNTNNIARKALWIRLK